MKRHFMKGLKALSTGVMTFCVASFCFTSCYDDSALNERIDDVESQISALDEKIEAIKTQLQALTSRVDALYTLEFQVNDKNELQYSFDGGTTWVSTGVTIHDECTCVVPDPCTCKEVSLVDNGESVTITVGDQSFTIEKPEEIVFEIRAGKVYFESEGVQSISIKSSGIEDVTVMSVPKGWEAEIDVDGLLVVTAPDYADTEYTYDADWNEIPPTADYLGVIKVHACSVEGKCMVGKLPVEVSQSPVVVKAYAGKYFVTSTSQWTTLFYGISPKATYKEDAKVILDAVKNGDYVVQDSWKYIANPVAEGNIADVLGYEPKLGEEYVVWAFDSWAGSYNVEDLVLAYYSPVDVTVKEDEAKKTPYDIFVSIEVQGADSYYAYAIPDTGSEIDIAYEKENLAMNIGGYWCPAKLHTSAYSGSLYSVAEGSMGSAYGMGSPEKDCYLLILPVDGRPVDQYTAADVKDFKFTTSALKAGGTLAVTATQVYEYVSYGETVTVDPNIELAVEVKPASEDKWAWFYFSWMTPEEYNLCGGDDTILASYLASDTWAKTGPQDAEFPYVAVQQVEPEQTMHFVAFFVDENGQFGPLTKMKLTSAKLERSEILITEATDNLTEGKLKNNTVLEFSPKTDLTVSQYKYIIANSDNWDYDTYYNMTDAELADEIHFSKTATVIKPEELVDGKIVIDGHEYDRSYRLAVLPYEGSNPGKSASILDYECVFELAGIVDDPAQFVSEPVVTFSIPEMKDGNTGESYYWNTGYSHTYSVSFNVAPAAGTEVVALLVDPVTAASYGYDHSISNLAKASGLWAKNLPGQSYYICNFTEADASDPRYIADWESGANGPLTPYILVSWVADGTYYYKEISLADEFAFMAAHLAWDGTPADVTATPDGKQWVFNWTAMQMGDLDAVIDLGVSEPGKAVVAYDPVVLGAPAGTAYQVYNLIDYEVAAFNETCGLVVVTSYNMAGEAIAMNIPYYNLTETSCTFETTNLLMQTAYCTAQTVSVDMTGGGIAQ